jgi:hypothetical protein
VGLDRAAGDAFGLIADEQHVVAFVNEHALEIVHHPAPAAMPLAAMTTAGQPVRVRPMLKAGMRTVP